MRAIRVHESGGIDAMRLDKIPRPLPGAGEVLVAVKAAGVGPWDRLVREGQSGLGHALPLTLGSDVSGTVAALGADLDVFAPGETPYMAQLTISATWRPDTGAAGSRSVRSCRWARRGLGRIGLDEWLRRSQAGA